MLGKGIRKIRYDVERNQELFRVLCMNIKIRGGLKSKRVKLGSVLSSLLFVKYIKQKFKEGWEEVVLCFLTSR